MISWNATPSSRVRTSGAIVDNLATVLGFVGRVVRGKRKKRWLADVLKQAGEKADYIEAFD